MKTYEELEYILSDNNEIKKIFDNTYQEMVFKKTLLTIMKYKELYNTVVSFSGGKDSTILLDLIRRFINSEEKAVFNNTKNEYPEIVDFVKTFKNVDWIEPKLNFFKVIEKYGLPIISKEVSRYLSDVTNPKICKKLKDIRMSKGNFSVPQKWRYFIPLIEDKKIKISDKCCYHLKKAPLNKYASKHKIKYFTGERAEESNLRKRYHTCIQKNKCIPLRLWTDDMIEKYIKFFNVEICSIYNTEKRTGCMYCLYGVHMEQKKTGTNRFERMKETHPSFFRTACIKFDLEKVLDLYLNGNYKANFNKVNNAFKNQVNVYDYIELTKKQGGLK